MRKTKRYLGRPLEKNEHELCRTKTGNTTRNSKALPSSLPHILGKKDLT
jgi:hypothetical protein